MLRAGDAVPEWDVTRWFGGDVGSLRAQRGRVVVVHAFQMLCPGCIYRGIPQAIELTKAVDPKEVRVLGLHTVFEHHEAMGDASLAAFLDELRVPFPVGVDRHDTDQRHPATMRAWGLRGTPSTLVIDRDGRLVHQAFGAESDLALALTIGRLLEPQACADGLCAAG